MQSVPFSVAESPEFAKRATKILGDDKRLQLISDLATVPEAGTIIPGTGGVRKFAGVYSRGKSGGARVIYYYHSDTLPIFLLTIFPKTQKPT